MTQQPASILDNGFAPLGLDALRETARINRLDVAAMFMAAGNGHFGSCYSCTEIVTALYFAVMRVDATRPDWPDRDRFVLGKGHAAPTLYSALIRRGFIPEAWIHEFEARVGARLMTHPSRRYQPGIDSSQGALGHGLSNACGMALAGRLDGRDYRVYAVLGDGELHEGSVWEAAAFAPKHRLDNLVAIVDRNGLCVDGRADEVLPLEPLADRWTSFGWDVVEADGHDLAALLPALDVPRFGGSGRPRVVIARTVKGRGVSFMEDVRGWHADVIAPAQYEALRSELREVLR
ncbi:Apulose-4-phosphate transketolase subunit A [Methylobacterium crusticola]|uniref:Apulose-4-phosphate transketolase subunit A n=1 Tax=Methylobacterium crusticola TaxID=1697972 RepID=A0ABQ4QYE8_9HYPH|nr:transketolase [Methylobacterium crusticola]GJD49750.1 Apulose-4-phosphate transketolase subunit A [Methylobacterium crusticola]